MQKIKISLAAMMMTLVVGFTFAANLKPAANDCSTQKDGKGILENHVTAGCTGSTDICCYRIPDNFVFRTLP